MKQSFRSLRSPPRCPALRGSAHPCAVPADHATLQSAFADAACDPVQVAAGTYFGNFMPPARHCPRRARESRSSTVRVSAGC
jgi:hypothetical protein